MTCTRPEPSTAWQHRACRTALALLLTMALVRTTPGASAQQVPIARVSAGGIDIWVAAEDGSAAAIAVFDVAWQPLSLAGAVARERLRADLPREADPSGPAASIRLPQGGSLYAVRDATSHALLHVRPDGSVHRAVSVDVAPGDAGLASAVAVSRDGSTALLATTPMAGGNALWLDLDAGTPPVDLTPGVAPLAIDADSLRLSADRAWFLAGGEVYRADLTTFAAAQPVPLGLGPGSTPLSELVLSADGLCAAVVVEHPGGLRDVFVINPQGTPTRVTAAPGDIDLPGLGQPGGPFMALSTDGSLLALRQTILAKQELFVRRVDLGAPALQVTADANYDDTIDGIGVIGFADFQTVVFAAGEIEFAAGQPIVDSADIFRATFTPGGMTLQNITLTSGQALPPFLETGELEIIEALDDPGGQRTLLIVDPDNGDFGVLAVPHDGSSGYATLLSALQLAPSLVALDDRVAILSQPDFGQGTNLFLLHPLGVLPNFQSLGTAPDGIRMDRFAVHPASQFAALVVSASPGFELPVFLHLPSGLAAAAWPVTFGAAATLAFSPQGQLISGAGPGGGPFLFASFPAPSVGVVLPVPTGQGYPLGR